MQSLVERCVDRDKNAWDNFVERFSGIVFWAIRGKAKEITSHYSQQDVEDIFQNVFTLLWEKERLKQIKDREKIASWIVIVAATCTMNYFRSRRKEGLRVTIPVDEEYGQIDHQKITEQERLYSVLEEVISFLPCRERVILRLSYLHGRTHREIAELLAMPQNTVSSLIKRSKEKLRKELQTRGYSFS
ncbi:MAG: sigma-70 family RNA polymerase sigma factor [Candidatus Omnitrophota bacterium]